MALTCSLLGHAFDDYEVVRDREERGSEVVTQVREVAVCDRCGAERILSENTEVTSIVDAPSLDTDEADEAGDEDDGEEFFSPDDTESPSDLGTDGTTTVPEGTDEPVPDEGAELVGNDGSSDVGGLDDTTATPADVEDTAVGAEAATHDEDASDSAAAPTANEADDGAEGSGDGDDDAVILTDSPEEREYGEWPSHDGQQYQPWDPDRLLDDPDREEGDDGPTVAEVMGTNGHDDDAEVEDGESDDDDGPDFEETAAVTDGDAVLSCPNCAFQSPVAAVSLRSGDACPDCRAGYLVAERNP